MNALTMNDFKVRGNKLKNKGRGKHGADKRNKKLSDRERAVSGSGRYYRKRVGGCVRTTFLFSQNTGRKCCLLSLSLSPAFQRNKVAENFLMLYIHLTTMHTNILESATNT